MDKRKETITITYDELNDFLKEMDNEFKLQHYAVTLKGHGYHNIQPQKITKYMWEQLKSKEHNSTAIAYELFKEMTYETFMKAYYCVENLLFYCKHNKNVFIPDYQTQSYKYPPFHPNIILNNMNDYTAERIRESGKVGHAIAIYYKTKRFLEENKPKEKQKINKTTAGIVYLLERTDKPQYKIGVTTNIERRLNQLVPKMPFEVTVANKIKSNDIYGSEAKLHKKYKDKHINGEWFALDKKDVKYIKSISSDNIWNH